MNTREILQNLQSGALNIDQALEELNSSVERDLGFARIDIDRARRKGLPEVIFCPGKTPEQISSIMTSLIEAGQNVLATRATPEQYAHVQSVHPDAVYEQAARIILYSTTPANPGQGLVSVVCAGTSDIPVAEEAAITAECAGARVERVTDVGVAGLHRLIKHLPLLKKSRAVVVVAGMEGALPSVIGGLIDKPIIAVPTSIGYGSGIKGLAALLAMLNSCVPGISVVNIDNGFGAGVSAALINRIGERQ